ncbi:putative beta-glucosidase I [Hypsizygus marmoreus]|uniref:beta-glucosidase n=1 Tax=Hypsizygus marmoreus TaxID=39966 RepID=A0A369IXV2_HYPMA|nr:putative beta-glucosidase I [Hypsizygus marmoreus]
MHFANAYIDAILESLTTDEEISLTAGVGFRHTHQIERLGVPAIKVSDRPSGIRGNYFFMGTPAKCLPSATALAATWDTKSMEEVGLKLLAPEAKLRAASVVLAPTSNIQSSFESFSEDPFLSGLLAASYVKSVQSGGIVQMTRRTTDKPTTILSTPVPSSFYSYHNDCQSAPLPILGYNRVNGTYVSEGPFLLMKLLRDEWVYKGLVMSDWLGIYRVDLSVEAGLDLEMPETTSGRRWTS